MITALFLTALLQTSVVRASEGVSLQEQKLVNASSVQALESISVVEVRSSRSTLNNDVNSSLTELTASEIRAEAPKHPNEIFDRVPGAWASAGSGQEHLTAIRSPVLTGAGACAAFMVLEDDIPTRPSGFCNVNQLFEVNIAQAKRIDVVRTRPRYRSV
jgi:iron complex outermembrane receptor protein